MMNILILECQVEGGKKDIQFQMILSVWIDQSSLLPCIDDHLLALKKELDDGETRLKSATLNN